MVRPSELKAAVHEYPSFMASLSSAWAQRARENELSILTPPPQPEPKGDEWKHYHRWPEIFFQLRGTNHFEMQDSFLSAPQGSLTLIPRMTAHRETREKHRGYYAHVCMTITTESVGCHLAGLPPLSKGRYHMAIAAVRRTSPKSAFLLELCEEIIRSLRSKKHDLVLGLSTSLLAYLSEVFDDYQGTTLPSLVTDCRRIAMRQLHDPSLSVDFLASRLGCHPDHLSRTFSSATGETLRGFIIRNRMLLAQQLLSTTRIPIQEVAQLTGYTDHAYFSARFKDFSQSSPSEYRRIIEETP